MTITSPMDENNHSPRKDSDGDIWKWGLPAWSDTEGWWLDLSSSGEGMHGPFPSLARVVTYTAGPLQFVEPREECNELKAIRDLASNPEAAMDLWWEACDDVWAVPDDLPARFLLHVLKQVNR